MHRTIVRRISRTQMRLAYGLVPVGNGHAAIGLTAVFTAGVAALLCVCTRVSAVTDLAAGLAFLTDSGAIGFAATAFRATGFAATAFRATGFAATAFRATGFAATAFRATGFAATAFRATGFVATAFRAAALGNGFFATGLPVSFFFAGFCFATCSIFFPIFAVFFTNFFAFFLVAIINFSFNI